MPKLEWYDYADCSFGEHKDYQVILIQVNREFCARIIKGLQTLTTRYTGAYDLVKAKKVAQSYFEVCYSLDGFI